MPTPTPIAPPTMLSTPLLALPLLAQITVTPGDPAALQNAIDAAPAGSTILVQGGTYDPITIDKPLELIAEPRAALSVVQDCPTITSRPLVTIDGPGTGRVTLQNFETFGALDGSISAIVCGLPSPLVLADGLDELWLIDCEFRTSWSLPSGSVPGAAGVSTSVPYLVVADSVIEAIDADTDLDAGAPQFPGILAPDSDVLISDSHVAGGSYRSVLSCPGPPVADGLIVPAPAVIAGRVFSVDSELVVDNTTDWICFPGLEGVVQFNQPSVQALVSATLDDTVEANSVPQLGSTWDLTADLSASGGLLFVAFDLADPVFLPGIGWNVLSLDEVLFTDPLGAGTSSRSYPIPAVNALIGFELAAVALDLEAVELGGPVVAQVR